MMIIRTIAAMMRVLFPGPSLPLCVEQMSVCVRMCVSVSVSVNERERERVSEQMAVTERRSYPLKIILCVKETSSVTFHTRVALSLQ